MPSCRGKLLHSTTHKKKNNSIQLCTNRSITSLFKKKKVKSESLVTNV